MWMFAAGAGRKGSAMRIGWSGLATRQVWSIPGGKATSHRVVEGRLKSSGVVGVSQESYLNRRYQRKLCNGRKYAPTASINKSSAIHTRNQLCNPLTSSMFQRTLNTFVASYSEAPRLGSLTATPVYCVPAPSAIAH